MDHFSIIVSPDNCIHVVLQPFRARPRPLALPRSSLVTQERGVQQLLLLHPGCQKPRNW